MYIIKDWSCEWRGWDKSEEWRTHLLAQHPHNVVGKWDAQRQQQHQAGDQAPREFRWLHGARLPVPVTRQVPAHRPAQRPCNTTNAAVWPAPHHTDRQLAPVPCASHARLLASCASIHALPSTSLNCSRVRLSRRPPMHCWINCCKGKLIVLSWPNMWVDS